MGMAEAEVGLQGKDRGGCRLHCCRSEEGGGCRATKVKQARGQQ